MTTPLETLLQRRNDLVAKLETAQKEIGILDAELAARFGSLLKAFNTVAGEITGANIEGPDSAAPHQPQPAHIPGTVIWPAGWAPYRKKKELAPLTLAMIAVLKAAGRPMKPGEIYEALVAANAPLTGKNPRNNVSAYLHNSADIFERTPEGWVLKQKEAA